MEALGFDFKLIVAYFINFLILILALRAFAYKPILGILEKRKQAIADGIAAADKVRQEAELEKAKFQEELEAARQSSQEEANKIAKQTAEMREKILADARKEAAELKEKARSEIETEREALQGELRKQVADLTIALTNKLVDSSMDEKNQYNLVDKFLAEMGE